MVTKIKRKRKKANKWFDPQGNIGWHKTDSQKRRRSTTLKKCNNDYLKAGRSLLSLANITQDAETKRKAKSDSEHFFRKYQELKSKRQRR